MHAAILRWSRIGTGHEVGADPRPMKRTTPLFRRSFLSFALLALAGCGAEPGAVDTTGHATAPLALPPTTEVTGVVRVNGCLGALLRNDQVLVPRACIPVAQRVDPSSLQVSYGYQTAAVRTVTTAVYIDGDMPFVIARLATPLIVDGDNVSYQMPFSPSGAWGSTVTCWRSNGAGLSPVSLTIVNNGYARGSFNATLSQSALTPALTAGDVGAPCFDEAGQLEGIAVTFRSYGTEAWVDLLRPSELLYFTQRILDGRVENDTRATAAPLKRSYYEPDSEVVYTGSTATATPDGPAATPCGCVSGGANVWFALDVGVWSGSGLQPEVVYLDTSGSDFDTSLAVTDANGNLLPGQLGTHYAGFCNDDAACTGGGFGSMYESRVSGVLQPGRYYVSLGGCGAGRYALHVQRRALVAASSTAPAPISGNGSASGETSGSSASQDACGGSASAPERAEWFVTCGGRPQFLSLCASDGGSYRRQLGTLLFDPSLSLQSAATGQAVACNDDGITEGATDCRGVGGDGAQYGSRLSAAVAPRGLNAVVIDNRTVGGGMSYTLRHALR